MNTVRFNLESALLHIDDPEWVLTAKDHIKKALKLMDEAPVRYWERQYEDGTYAGVYMWGPDQTRGRWIPDPVN